jgi:hypothetical protein
MAVILDLLVAFEWRASSVQHIGHEEGLGAAT